MTRSILILNAGSSSIKFALYDTETDDGQALITGRIGGIGRAPDFSATDRNGLAMDEGDLQALHPTADHGELTNAILNWIEKKATHLTLAGAGHRVVHGGKQFRGPARITQDVLTQLEKLTPLAPLHQPNNLAAVRAIAERHAGLPQVACFDTSFHRTMPRVAQLFGLPRELTDDGVIRYGFHGLSYEYITSVLPDYFGNKADGRFVIAHLGNGASLCAVNQKQCVTTTMGFTALHGLVMGRRSGTIDAGIVLHLLQERGMSVDAVWKMIYQESGLLGVSGISNSMQELTASDDPNAKEAVDLFCYRVVCEIGSLAAAMQGIDGLVFTAGIGENSPVVREAVCRQLGWLGLDLDSEANSNDARRGAIISKRDSRLQAAVIATDEQQVIARATRRLIG